MYLAEYIYPQTVFLFAAACDVNGCGAGRLLRPATGQILTAITIVVTGVGIIVVAIVIIIISIIVIVIIIIMIEIMQGQGGYLSQQAHARYHISS